MLMLACSATKASSSRPALDFYLGVMYQTYRTHVPVGAEPNVLVLSAAHGFLDPGTVIDPYDRRMDKIRAAELIDAFPVNLANISFPLDTEHVYMAGGESYRLVMRAAVDVLKSGGRLRRDVRVVEARGGIGEQRRQLGDFLRALPFEMSEQLGTFPNGVPYYRRAGVLSVGERVIHRCHRLPGVRPAWATIRSLFPGPGGPTACADIEETARGRARIVRRWVGLETLQPKCGEEPRQDQAIGNLLFCRQMRRAAA